MVGAELRVVAVNGSAPKNIMDLTDDELSAAMDVLTANELKVISIATPLLKCTLPNGPKVDSRFQQDIFNSKHTFEDQPRLTNRAFQIAKKTGAKIIRVFSYWRTVEPNEIFEQIVDALQDLSDKAADNGLIIGLENEHACNIGTAHETARVLAAIDHPNLQVVWDPANAYVAGEEPFPTGYYLLDPKRIAHIHAKDCNLDGHKALWCELGMGGIDWKGQLSALARDGYNGYIHIETHWPGPGGDKFEASRICGRNLMEMVSSLGKVAT